MSVWVMPSVNVYENFLKRSQAVARGRRRSKAVGTPWGRTTRFFSPKKTGYSRIFYKVYKGYKMGLTARFFFGEKRVVRPRPGYQDDPPCMYPPSVQCGSPLPRKAPFEKKKQSKRMTYKIKCWMT